MPSSLCGDGGGAAGWHTGQTGRGFRVLLLCYLLPVFVTTQNRARVVKPQNRQERHLTWRFARATCLSAAALLLAPVRPGQRQPLGATASLHRAALRACRQAHARITVGWCASNRAWQTIGDNVAPTLADTMHQRRHRLAAAQQFADHCLVQRLAASADTAGSTRPRLRPADCAADA